MVKNYLMAILNLNEDHINMRELTTDRPVASLPIAGRYRLIDFILSNITNSGIFNVGIFSQRKTRSLSEHLGDGAPWDLDRIKDGLYLFTNQYELNEKLARGDIQNIYENRDFISRSKQEYILVTTPFMIYNFNFEELLHSHINSGANITAMYKEVDNADVSFYGSFAYSISNNKLTGIGKNMCSTNIQNIAMDCVIMKKDYFLNMVYDNLESGEHIYLSDAINSKLLSDKVNLFKFNGYIKCIKDIRSYREFNRDILEEHISNEIFRNPNGLIYTKIKDEAPTYFSDDSKVENSIIASGSLIEGTVKNSIISRKVKIGKGAVVENSIIMQNCIIGENSYISNMISDKNATISNYKKLIGDFNMPIIIKKGGVI